MCSCRSNSSPSAALSCPLPCRPCLPACLQYNHLHILAGKGLLTLDDLFEGRFIPALEQSGAVLSDVVTRFTNYHPAGGRWALPAAAAKGPVLMGQATRHVVESVTRQLLQQSVPEGVVEVLDSTAVTGLLLEQGDGGEARPRIAGAFPAYCDASRRLAAPYGPTKLPVTPHTLLRDCVSRCAAGKWRAVACRPGCGLLRAAEQDAAVAGSSRAAHPACLAGGREPGLRLLVSSSVRAAHTATCGLLLPAAHVNQVLLSVLLLGPPVVTTARLCVDGCADCCRLVRLDPEVAARTLQGSSGVYAIAAYPQAVGAACVQVEGGLHMVGLCTYAGQAPPFKDEQLLDFMQQVGTRSSRLRAFGLPCLPRLLEGFPRLQAQPCSGPGAACTVFLFRALVSVAAPVPA